MVDIHPRPAAAVPAVERLRDDIDVLDELRRRRRPLTAVELAAALGWGSARAPRALARLRNAGAVRPAAGRRWELAPAAGEVA